MSTLRNLPKTEWRGFFDRMSEPLLGKRAEVEVAALDLGDQVVDEWIPMIGITYDSKDDLVDVALERTNRLIRHPTAITVEEAPTGLTSVAVVDAEGARHVVRLKDLSVHFQEPVQSADRHSVVTDETGLRVVSFENVTLLETRGRASIFLDFIIVDDDPGAFRTASGYRANRCGSLRTGF